MINIGRKFKIKLCPHDYTEHKTALLVAHDGKVCTITGHLFSTLYITDISVPEGTPNSDYVRDGKLLVMTDKDGVLQ